MLESYDLCMLRNSEACYEVAKIQYNPTMSQFSGLSILGSCDGLLFLGDTCSSMIPESRLDNNLCLWNPSTRRYRPLPVTPIHPRAYGSWLISCCSLYGFGYNAISKDYEVVSIVCFNSEYSHEYSCDWEVKVYSLRNNSWRKIGRPFWDICYPRSEHEKRGALVNGVLHWVVIPSTIEHEYSVICFDIEGESYFVMPLPGEIDDDDKLVNLKVTALDEYLCLICGYENHVEAWMMKDYLKKESWIKLFAIAGQREFRGFVPLCIRENGILLLDDNVLYLYDPEDESVKKLAIKDIPERIRFATSYTESLVALY
ncbi:hypothetical protein IFM89_021277 [Coptis chinensis]|uniref:F-box associated beta-propeller type 1 domain-containing protein n=1 Tax=Coptis chinensis TaxID=261450 RepID=A0A835M087_9MAGN|nr:hypothetical protein IFM89_021277 [Coptis chinensis]